MLYQLSYLPDPINNRLGSDTGIMTHALRKRNEKYVKKNSKQRMKPSKMTRMILENEP